MSDTNSPVTPNNNGSNVNSDLWGWPIKNWVKLIITISISACGLFVCLPFLIALVVPIFADDPNDFLYLVDTLDGVSLVLGLTGTVASVVSIVMTIADQKRFKNEKEQTEKLIDSVGQLHNEIGVVEKYVRETHEKHRELALQLYNANVIPKQPDEAKFGVSTDMNGVDWADVCQAQEIPLEEG